MQTLQGTLESFQTSEAKKSTKGFSDYFSHTYTVNGLKFSKFGKVATSEVPVGSTVLVLFETKQSGKKDSKGNEIIYRNIDSITVMETQSTGSINTHVKSQLIYNTLEDSVKALINSDGGGTGGKPTVIATTKTNGSLTARDVSILRQSALKLVPELARLIRIDINSDSSLQDIFNIADEVVKYTSAPHLDSQIVDKLNNKS